MADDQQQSQEQPDNPSKWQRIENFITHNLPWASRHVQELTGIPFRYRRSKRQKVGSLQPIKRDLTQKKVKTDEKKFLWWRGSTDAENLIELGRRRVDAVKRVEKSWNIFEQYNKETGEKGYVQELEDIYLKATIFLDPNIAGWEYPLYERGITKADVSGAAKKAYTDDDAPIRERDHVYDEINIEIGGKPYKYPVPAKCKIRYSIAGMKRTWIVEISPFGYRRQPLYLEDYSKAIDQICEGFEADVLAGETEEPIKDTIKENILNLKEMYKNNIAEILNGYLEFERKARAFVKNGGEGGGGGEAAAKISPKIGTMRGSMKEIFPEESMIYSNSYEIIQPIVFGNAYRNAEILDELKKYDRKQGSRWYKKPDEVDHGLDRYGYPLEVDKDGYIMIDKHDQDGNPTSENTWRQIPGGESSRFKKFVDALEIANYITNMHDRRRDDLRDGRFHYNTLTIMDYVQANNRSIWDLWQMEPESKLRQKSVYIDLLRPIPGVRLSRAEAEPTRLQRIRNKLTKRMGVPQQIPEATGGYPVPYKIVPTNKLPAFDLGYLRRSNQAIDWRHIGNKYYYEVPEHGFALAGQNKEKHISSRGVSMYIIEKLTREIGPWSEVMEELDQIGQAMGGLDYGVRPWDMWGTDMTKSVFQWRNMMGDINKVMRPKHDAAGYKKMYAHH